MDIIENARTVAERAHRGQFRRDGTTPYLSHPAGVAGILNDEAPEVIAAAWLHDVLEDTKETAETLGSVAATPKMQISRPRKIF